MHSTHCIVYVVCLLFAASRVESAPKPAYAWNQLYFRNDDEYDTIRFEFTELRDTEPCFTTPNAHGAQIGDIRLYTTNDRPVNLTVLREDALEWLAFDGNKKSTWKSIGWPLEDRYTLTLELEEPVVIGSYQMTTARDCPRRDPVSWRLLGCTACARANTNTSAGAPRWTLLDTRVHVNMPTERGASTPRLPVVAPCDVTCGKCRAAGDDTRGCEEECDLGDDIKPCSNTRCPLLPTATGRECSPTERRPGDTALCWCVPGFRRARGAYQTCTAEGTWVGEPVVCEELQEGPIPGGFGLLASGGSVKDAIRRIHLHKWPAGEYPGVDLMVRTGAVAISQLLTMFRSVALFWPAHIGDKILILDDNEEWMRSLIPSDWKIFWEKRPYKMHGYIFNQLSNFWADNYTNPNSEVVCIMDADSILSTPVIPELIFKTRDDGVK